MRSGYEIQDLCFGYTDRRRLFDNFNFRVRNGEFVTITGHSGCGKSTFLYLLAGLLKANSGSIRFNQKVNPPPGPDRFTVFQSDNLFFWKTALGNVALGPRLVHRLTKKESRRESLALLERVGLKGFEKYYPHQLSGGMRQRVGLARAFAVRPDAILMDEPFGSLDAQTRVEMQNLLIEIWGEYSGTIVFITHDIDEAITLSDRIVVFGGEPVHIKTEIRIPEERLLRRSKTFLPRREAIRDEIMNMLGAEQGARINHEDLRLS